MPATCLQCGSLTEWNDQVGSAVCISCGSLEDPSQSILTNAQFATNDSRDLSFLEASASAPLKSLRSGNNWDLAGQGKEARDRRNSFTMVEYIKSLAVCLNAPGLSPRAVSLFNQTKSSTNFTWGRKAKLVAGACIAIALRESNRPDALLDIASLLSLPQKAVTREFTSITSTLGLSLTLLDPSVHIPNLQSHLSSEVLSTLPPTLTKSIRALCLRSVASTAVSLSCILTRLCADHEILRLPVPATACGIFVLALEAENRAPLNSLGELAKCLGSRYQISKSVVMTRYKTLQDQVASWIEEVPWLDKYRTKQGRAKVCKRMVAARGLKDVIKFQDDIWQRRHFPLPNFELSEDEKHEDRMDNETVIPTRNDQQLVHSKVPKALIQVQNFLMDPLHTPVPSNNFPQSNNRANPMSLTTYFLTNVSSHPHQLPTRLQLLSALRGGSTEEQIPDDELFTDGELDNLFRSDEEVEVLRKVFEWTQEDENMNDHYEYDTNTNSTQAGTHDSHKTGRPKASSKRKRPDDSQDQNSHVEELGIWSGSALRPRKRNRVDLEAFAQFMDDDHGMGEAQDLDDGLGLMGLMEAVDDMDEEEDEDVKELDDEHQDRVAVAQHLASTSAIRMNASTSISTAAGRSTRSTKSASSRDRGEVILAWRPPSPEGGVTFSDSRYEEEYD